MPGELNAFLSGTARVEVADFNGDGKSDLFVFDSGILTIYSLNRENKLIVLYTSAFDYTLIAPSEYPYKTTNMPILIGDYNGDGKSDVMIPKAYGSSQWYKYTSTGTTVIKEEKTYLPVFSRNDSNNTYNYIPIDYNNDGKTDLIKVLNYTENAKGYINIICYSNINGDFIHDPKISSTGAKTDINIYALPVFLPQNLNSYNSLTNRANSTLEIAFFNQNKIHFFNSGYDYKKSNLLTNITTGNGVQEAITYIPLDSQFASTYQNTTIYKSSKGIASYPNLDITIDPNLYVVSKLEKQSKDVYKKRLFVYYGAVSNVEGLGFMGFRSVSQTDWYNETTDMFSNITKNDIDLRGASVEGYFTRGFREPLITVSGTNNSPNTPADFITKSISSYESNLLANKVFRLKNTVTKQFNTLTNTNNEESTSYDSYDNPLKSTILLKEGSETIQTIVSDVTYYNNTSTSPYIIGRPLSNLQSVSVTGSTMSSEEIYDYHANGLLKQIKRKGINTNYISEDNEYDAFGNIVNKRITAVGLTPREIKYEYDTSGRFLTKFIDNEKLSTSFVYNSNGTLKSETNPYSLITSYTYDPWFKRLTVKDDKLDKTISYVYTRNAEKTIVTTTTDALDGSASEETFDDLGRKIKSGTKDLNGNFTYVSFMYDVFDRNYKTSEPYFGTNPSQWNETKYDVYGRPEEFKMFNTRTTTALYNGLTSNVTDGQKTKSITKNAIGNIMSSTETTGGTIKYDYFANGNLKQTDYNGIKIDIEQDGWGNKTKLTDPSAGVFTYKNNDLGELEIETSKNGEVVTTITRDINGKPIKKTVIGSGTETETIYVYDSGLLIKSTFTDKKEPTGSNEIITTYTYDDIFKRISKIVEDKTGVSKFTTSFSYDELGRVDREIKQAELGQKKSTITTQRKYNNGSLYQILDDATKKVLWQTNTLNAKGQILESVSGNGIKTTSEYDTNGYLSKIQYDRTTGQTGNVLTLNTKFDFKTDNLENRKNSAFNYAEDFKYDEIDRLKEFTNKLGFQETQNYEPSGKIKNNALGTYEYGIATKPYQNTAIALTAEALDYYSNKSSVVNENGEIFSDGMENQKGWGQEKYPNTNFYSYSIGGAHGGQSSLKLDNKTNTKYYVYADNWIDVNNAVDTQYTVSAWVYTYYSQGEIALLMKNDCETSNISIDNTVAESQLKWTKITKTILVPAYAKKINIRLDSNYGTVWFDDVQINKIEGTAPIEETNEVFNDGVENQSGWGTVKYPNTNFYSYSIGGAHGGQVSLKLENKGGAKCYVHSDKWININNAVDTKYTISAWVYTYYGQGEITLFMKKECEAGYYTQVDNAVAESQMKWTKVTKTILVPAYIKRLNIRLENNFGSVWFDDIQINRTEQLPPTPIQKAQNITYNAFKSPLQITETGVDKISFSYNDNNQRSTMYYGSLEDEALRPLRKHYAADGTMEIKENVKTGITEFITYIGGDGYSAPIVVKSDGLSTVNYLYLHHDYQGTILAITDANANVVEKRLFDAWGSIIKVQDGAGNTLAGLTILDRGYTGHEHLQSVGLINMNARLYDPMLHRFLQVDNYIQDPTNTQNYNQYGYVLNNPLLYTDPSGNTFNDGKDCKGCGNNNNNPVYNPDKMQYNKPIADGLHRWVGGWASARNIDEAGTAVGKAARDAVNFISRNIRSLFGGGHRSSGPPPNMSSYANLNKSFDFKAANNITDQRPLIQQYNEQPRESYEEYDPKGGVLTAIGSGIALGEYKMFNKDTWYSLKMMRTYNQSFNGNGYTGGKIASALKISKGLKWGGWAVGAYNAGSTFIDYQNSKITGFTFAIEETSNGFSTFGGLNGVAWGIGWEGGRAITKTDWYQDWKYEYWYPFRYEHFGY